MSFRSPLARWLLSSGLTLKQWRAFRAYLSGLWLEPECLDPEDLTRHLRAWRRGMKNQNQENAR